MRSPTTVGALMELMHGASYSKILELIELLRNLLESQYSMHKTRLKSEIAVALCRHGGTSTRLHLHPHSAIAHQFILANPDPAKRLCLFADASSTHWTGVLTQVDSAEIAQ